MKKEISFVAIEKKRIQTKTIFFKHEQQAVQYLRQILKNSICLYDERFKNKKLIRSFPMRISVKSGESLKSLKSFSTLLPRIHDEVEQISKKDLHFVAVGGGSIGDFVSFIASIYKRGCPVVQIPTTWLSTVDSAHGGKSALNLKSKNQLGTIHYPSEVLVIPEYLQGQSTDLMMSALGEVLKYAFLDRKLFRQMKSLQIDQFEQLYSLIPRCVAIKNSVLKKDPFETTGERFFLNLGHTVGHGFEATHGFPHGLSVLLGLEFMLRWSVQQKLIRSEELQRLIPVKLRQMIKTYMHSKKIFYDHLIKNRKFIAHVGADKKVFKQGRIREVFILRQKCQIIDVSIASYEAERKRQILAGEHGSFLF